MQELFDRKFISAIKSLNVEDAPLARRMIKGRLDKYMPESIDERDAIDEIYRNVSGRDALFCALCDEELIEELLDKQGLSESNYCYRDGADTNLNGCWKYSPLFKHPYADDYISLTGKRQKDYREIEKITNSKHIPGKSVWHHVWEEKYGKYRMRLVDLSLHQKTCPHAGGCKKWSLCNGKSYKNRNAYACGVELYIGEQPKKVGVDDKIVKDHRRFINCRPRGMQPYMDLELDYVFITPSEYEWRCTPTRNNTTLSRTQRSYMKGIKKTNRTTFRAFGLDPYGNVFEVDKRGRVAFYDHEVGQRILIPYVML